MHVWVLETFTRNDCFCEYDSNIVAVYSKSSFKKAREHFKDLCLENTDDEYEIERWKNENGYHFSSKVNHYKGFEMNYVGLIKKELL